MAEIMMQPKLQKQVSQKVKIAIDEVLDRYECPICMCKLAEPYITKCGHTFCKVSLLRSHTHLSRSAYQSA